MDRFYIKKLTVTGQGKEPSIITFGKGLNIVCGPSDTGKSYIIECIDYIFGGSTIPIDPKEGYDCVKMIVETSQGTVTAERFFNTTQRMHVNYTRMIKGSAVKIRKEELIFDFCFT